MLQRWKQKGKKVEKGPRWSKSKKLSGHPQARAAQGSTRQCSTRAMPTWHSWSQTPSRIWPPQWPLRRVRSFRRRMRSMPGVCFFFSGLDMKEIGFFMVFDNFLRLSYVSFKVLRVWNSTCTCLWLLLVFFRCWKSRIRPKNWGRDGVGRGQISFVAMGAQPLAKS